ncbi:MAG: fumarylacetoacetate hydrolase family protein [Psychromonas sp.]
MNKYAFTPAKQASATIQGSDALFPVRRIYCIGRNYADHAIEMGHDPQREPPFFFQKNADNVNNTGVFPYPAHSKDVHFEMEMVVALKSGGINITIDDALEHVFGYALGLDMTRRDLQSEMKKMGRPWEIGKAFEQSAPMGPIIPVSEIGHPNVGEIQLKVNDRVHQKGDLSQMLWKVPQMIVYLSNYYELAAGDLIFTGTPAGVGAIVAGDVMLGSIENIGEFIVTVV